MKTVNISAKDVQLMLEDEKLGEAVASISLNPNVTWLKMVITDDKPNANGMRIPAEEFANVVNTAIYMPIKMAEGEIAEGHEESLPIGSIAHLADKGDHVIALAALWNRERPKDIEFLKERHENGQSIDVSWELNYDVKASKKDDKVLELKNIEMNAVTIVGLPSYMGRTGVTALASSKNQGDNDNMDTINREDHDKIVKGLNEKLGELESTLETVSTERDELKAQGDELTSAKAELDELKPEYDELKKFKDEADAAKEREAKLEAVHEKFAKAGIEAAEDYFTKEREASFLEMDESALDFFIQELVAFKSEESDDDEATASLNITSKVPDVKSEDKEVDENEIVAHLKGLDKTKE